MSLHPKLQCLKYKLQGRHCNHTILIGLFIFVAGKPSRIFLYPHTYVYVYAQRWMGKNIWHKEDVHRIYLVSKCAQPPSFQQVSKTDLDRQTEYYIMCVIVHNEVQVKAVSL